MNEIYQQAIAKYARIDPRDYRDTEVFAREETWSDLFVSVGQNPKEDQHGVMTLFGLTARIDDSLPYGKIDFITENAHDRAIRRARASGHTVNVVRTDLLPPLYPPSLPPTPTLRALLKHWMTRKRKR